MDRRDRQTPSPQMYRSAGENHRPRTPSPSPTNTLTPSYGSRQQSRDVSVGQPSSESYEEAIELRPRNTSEASTYCKNAHSSGDRPREGSGGGMAVEILINIHDESCGYRRGSSADNDKDAQPLPVNNGPILSQGGQPNGRTKEKHLTFSESTEQLLSAKTSPIKENGSVETGKVAKGDVGKSVVCVNVNKSSLKATTPLQVDSVVAKKSAKGKDQETML
ncbi:hypothetical protein C7M84_004019 [Penaeus vannamei]|uniref:Uncharacterized protein n=2 Tax=Penaeus vannamei TaxID=6689 RepID=A0A423TLL0_PENVA|nr:hypothetical protein C7M84_004019 [Penaeus vannamei]